MSNLRKLLMFLRPYLTLLIFIILNCCAGTIKTTKKTLYKEIAIPKKAYIVSVESSNFIKFKFGLFTPFAYIILPDDSPQKHTVIGNTDKVIKAELEKYGIQSEIGKKGDAPKGIDIIVLYNDTWRWDIKKVLDKLEIVFISAIDNKEIARSVYNISKNKEMHNFPTPEKEVPKMIKQLLNK